MSGHMIAFVGGFLLDLLLGDPYALPHPIRLIGKLVEGLERLLRRKGEGQTKEAQLRQGVWLVVGVLAGTAAAAFSLLILARRIHPWAGIAAELVMTYQLLAAKCLKTESMKVFRRLQAGDPEGARRAVSMIVGRDTAALDEEGITKAAIETVAENTADGVIAPMLYTALFGPVCGFLYKAVNTMDSMVGYKNGKYLYFGRAAAKLDDALNWIPSRLSACFMIAAAFLCLGVCLAAEAMLWFVWQAAM